MANWFNNKKESSHVYTMEDKQREQAEFKMTLDLTPLTELWYQVCCTMQVKSDNLINTYKDFLGIMKSFYGADNPLIAKFDVLINRFQGDCDIYYRTVKKSIDDALDKKRIELKSKD